MVDSRRPDRSPLFSGLLIFSTDPDMYYLNRSFLLKMAALVLAIIFNYTIHRQALSKQFIARIRSPDRLPFAAALDRRDLWRHFHRRRSGRSRLKACLFHS